MSIQLVAYIQQGMSLLVAGRGALTWFISKLQQLVDDVSDAAAAAVAMPASILLHTEWSDSLATVV